MYISRFFDLRAVLRAMYRLDVSIDELLDNITNVN
jgi:hypothetical protein